MPSTPDLSCDPMDTSGPIGYRLNESIRRKRYLPPTPVDLALIKQHSHHIVRNSSFPNEMGQIFEIEGSNRGSSISSNYQIKSDTNNSSSPSSSLSTSMVNNNSQSQLEPGQHTHHIISSANINSSSSIFSSPFRPRGYTMPTYLGSTKSSQTATNTANCYIDNSNQTMRQRSMSACSKRSSISPHSADYQHIGTHYLSTLTSSRPINRVHQQSSGAGESLSTSPGSSDIFSNRSSGESSPRVFKPCRILITGYDNVGKKTIISSLLSIHSPSLINHEMDNTIDVDIDLNSSLNVINSSINNLTSTGETIKIKLGTEYYEFTFDILNSSKDFHFIEKQVRKKDALMVVFSTTERKSFENAAQLLVLIKLNIRRQSPVILLVANKVDLERSREVTSEEARRLAARFDVKYLEISAILDYNIDLLMKQLSKKVWLNSINDSSLFDSSRSLRSLIAGSANDLFSNIGRKLSGRVFDRLWKGSKLLSKSCETLNNI